MSLSNNLENGSNKNSVNDHLHIVDHEEDVDILVDSIRYIYK